ncbi:hypothetical protein IVA79_34725 [Bradyrhizobium sp. 138]|uniref:septum formation initiator family protein n=1 Tax=Bradyrhizobium sp. 138 TaxID=2782615 RepID=UPI001FFBF814|nr:septum formation initiator family protein [Bradyrhizobium sp. 138]MCK1738988.1 hypothetical protein [Bradyrhizobium sp. 138]
MRNHIIVVTTLAGLSGIHGEAIADELTYLGAQQYTNRDACKPGDFTVSSGCGPVTVDNRPLCIATCLPSVKIGDDPAIKQFKAQTDAEIAQLKQNLKTLSETIDALTNRVDDLANR